MALEEAWQEDKGNKVSKAGVLVRRGAKVKRSPYGKRWLVESFFSVFKRWFGEYVSSLKFEKMNMLMMGGLV